MLFQGIYQAGPFIEIPVHNTVQKILESTFRHYRLFYEKSARNGRICGFCKLSFKCSIKQLLKYSDLTKVSTARLLTNFISVLQRISKWQSLNTVPKLRPFLLEQVFQNDQKNSFRKYSEKNFQEDNWSSPKSK